jgi:putative glycosyltransferase (TIGR04348 family)
MAQTRVMIVTPALASANNGNWHTAARWQHFLAPLAEVHIAQAWHGEAADALIALHARRSADSIARFHATHPQRPLALVLTGTDLYRDLENADASARHSLECASHVVVLQREALRRLAPPERAKARVIVQSATRVVRDDKAADFIAVGHLRAEKDPLTLMAAARRLGTGAPAPTIVHIGAALDEALASEARRTMAEAAGYRWLGALGADDTRQWIARSRALVHMSRMEGGANVVIEAVRSRVPVLASRIDGNVGLLGDDYAGYFPVGDAPALAELMQRFASDATLAATLAAQCAALEPQFAPEVEAKAIRTLLTDLLATIKPSSAAPRSP